MDVNKNSYTFGFAAIMVIVVAVILSGTSIVLKDAQYSNVELEKKQNILRSVGVEEFYISKEDSEYIKNQDTIYKLKGDTIFLKKSDKLKILVENGSEKIKERFIVSRKISESLYPIFIKEELVLNHLGEIINNLSAFDVELSKEVKKSIVEDDQNIPLEERTSLLPLYISEVEGEKKYIIPLRGKGLWGPIWGFISFNADLNTVFAAVFDHKAETPGLGAEINTPSFQDTFQGKTIFEEGEFVSIFVQKGGSNGDIHKVDGISGGTITSDGVTDMLNERLKRYLPYFRLMEDNKEKNQEEETEEVRLTMEAVNIDEKETESKWNMGKREID